MSGAKFYKSRYSLLRHQIRSYNLEKESIMFILILNWLFNSLLLSIIYIFAMACLVNDPHSFLYSLPEWSILALGFTSVWVLVLASFTPLNYFLLCLFSKQRKPTKEEMQRLAPVLSEVIQNANSLKGCSFELNKLRLLVNNALDFDPHTLVPNTISINALLIKGASTEELKSVLACGLAHLYYKDSLIVGAIVFASIPSRLSITIYDKCVSLLNLAFRVFGAFKVGGVSILVILLMLPFIIFLPLVVLNYFGSKLVDFSLLCMTHRYISRAYKFANDLGYSSSLTESLYS